MGGKAKDPNKAAMKIQKEQLKRLDAIPLPELQELALENPELVDLLNTEQLDETALADIDVDPRLKNTQLDALRSLQQRSEEGLTEQDKYAMEELLGQAAAQERSQRAAIEQSLEERGLADSGQGLLLRLQNQQASGNNARRQAMDLARQSRQGREAALANLANAASQVRNQDFSQQSQVASAKDRIAAANAQNRQRVAAQNLAARQQIENQRAQIANQNQTYNLNIPQQQFNNQLAKAGAQGNVANNLSSIAASAPQGPSQLQQIGTIAGGVAGGIFGGPAGISAGAGAGGAIGGALGSFEDGGMVNYRDDGMHGYNKEMSGYEDGGLAEAARKEKAEYAKYHSNFKKKYMKKVHAELLDEPERAKKEVTGQVPQYNDGGLFQPKQYNEQEIMDYALNKMKKDSAMMDKGMTPDGMVKLGEGNDMTSADVQTLSQSKEVLGTQESDLDGQQILKGLQDVGKIGSLLGGGKKKAPRPALNLTPSNIQAPQNVLGSGMNQVSSFANPFQAEDGGTYMAEDGSMMYKSDGEGDIVEGDSYERDRVDARLNSGEAVLNVAQQQRLMDLLRGRIGMDELGDEDIVEGVPRDYQEDLTSELDQEDEQLMMLKRLLESLGE